MRIWNKIWGKIQEQTKVDSIIYDLERKLIDIPSLLNCTIIDICLLTEEKKDLLINQINQALQETENLLVNLKTNLEQTSDNNTKKQLEYDIKNQENQKAKYSQIKEILNNQELQMHYLINYQAKINASHFFENNELIDIFEQFHLSLDFEPNDLILARENLENKAYTLKAEEKNKMIDQINRNYEILIDSVRLKAYRDTLQNPNLINILENRIKELKKEINSIEIPQIDEKDNSLLEPIEELTNENIDTPNDLNKNVEDITIEVLNDNEISKDNVQIFNESSLSIETLNNVNKDLLEEQKQKIEEQLIPSLISLNQQIKETHNDLLTIAKNSLLKQHKSLLEQNPEYQKILDELTKLN